eukprot:SAG31_NODE_8819_length_1382_cov_1.246298_2_plen_301_part_01
MGRPISETGLSWGVLVDDFSGDGMPDIFVVRDPARGGGNQLFINDNGVALTRTVGQRSLMMSEGVVVGDLDGDDSLDLIVLSSGPTQHDEPTRVYINNGAGVFLGGRISGQLELPILLNSQCENGNCDAAMVDYTSDGLTDVCVMSNILWCYRNMGTDHSHGVALEEDLAVAGHLAEVLYAYYDCDYDYWWDTTAVINALNKPCAQLRRFKTADLNGDGHVDFVIAAVQDRNVVLLSTGIPVFEETNSPNEEVAPSGYVAASLGDSAYASYSIAIGDLDSDGDDDLYFANHGDSDDIDRPP